MELERAAGCLKLLGDKTHCGLNKNISKKLQSKTNHKASTILLRSCLPINSYIIRIIISL